MQEPFLYSKSLRENIRFGRPDAHPEEIVEAAEAAHVHGSIEAFESGYETMVGERGVMLSGGQRQRVALARALLDRPALLVLDDALSAVDTETESLILENLRARQGNQTTILIAHRISTLMHADRILVLDRGRIVERGTHGELIAGQGLYRRLWEIQTDLEEDLARDLEHAGGGERFSQPSGSASPQPSARSAKPGAAYPEDESAQDASSTVAV
jgi:ATP-binding cassette, subfamily B, bacterial